MPRPLDDVRVVSIALNLPGPVAVARLVQLGAAVTKVEPLSGDPLQFAQPDAYATLHKGVTVRSLDLKSAEGLAAIHELLAEADLFLTSSRLAALDRLGLGWQTLGERYPNLCQVAIVGNLPPNENHPGHDLTYQAQFGLVTPPALPRATIADLGGALEAVEAAMGLLLKRSRHGTLPYAERESQVALAGSAEFFAQTLSWGLTGERGFLGGALAQYNLYQCEKGWVALAALEPHFWARLQAAIGSENPSMEQLRQIFQTRSADDWEEWGKQHDLPIVAVRE